MLVPGVREVAGELCPREPKGAQDLSACLRGCCLACVSQQEVLGRVNYSLNQVAQSPRAFWKLKVQGVGLPGSSVGGKVGVGHAKRCVWRGSEHVGGIFGGSRGSVAWQALTQGAGAAWLGT